MSRVCRRCGILDRRHNGQCRPCSRRRASEHAQSEKGRETRRRYEDLNKDKLREIRTENARQWNRANPKRVRATRFRLYGTDEAAMLALYEKQGRVCGLCGVDLPFRGKTSHIDHDHSIGLGKARAIRGIICAKCNARMAAIDDTEWLRKARGYLLRFDAVRAA